MAKKTLRPAQTVKSPETDAGSAFINVVARLIARGHVRTSQLKPLEEPKPAIDPQDQSTIEGKALINEKR